MLQITVRANVNFDKLWVTFCKYLQFRLKKAAGMRDEKFYFIFQSNIKSVTNV